MSKNILKKIKEILFSEEVVENNEMNFIDIQSGDIILRIDGDLTQGATVAQVYVNEEGEEIIEPLGDGEYEIEYDEKKWTLVITNNEIVDIVEIEEEEIEQVQEEEVEMSEETECNEEVCEHQEEEVVEVEQLFEEVITEKINNLEQKLEELINKFNESTEEFNKQIVELSKQPGGEEVKVGKSNFSQSKKEIRNSRDERLRSLRRK